MNIRQKYFSIIYEIMNMANELELNCEKYSNLILKIEKTELIVPIIGQFSAGKSTFLNNILCKNYLLTSITPETALATELRWSEEEYILAYKKDNTYDKYRIDEIYKIKEKSLNYLYLVYYINNEILKKIEPFILVDMPGFNSPLEDHNRAIFEYIKKGVHFMIFSSIEEGTINKSTLIQLESIIGYNRTFNVFLTKCNLKSKTYVNEIKENIKRIINDNFNIKDEIYELTDKVDDNFEAIINSLDTNIIYKNLFENEIKIINNDLVNQCNLITRILNKEYELKIEDIDELNYLIKHIEYTREKKVKELEKKYSDDTVNYIINKVSIGLNNSIDELVTLGMQNNEEALKIKITEIIEIIVINETKNIVNNICDSIITDININIGFSENTTFVNNIIDGISTYIGDKMKNNSILSSENLKLMSKTSAIFSILTNILNPLFEIAMVALPMLIDFFKKKNSENDKREKIKNNIILTVIPKIKNNLRNNLPLILKENIEKLIEEILSEFEKEINEKKEIIEKLKSDSKFYDLENKIDKVNNLVKYCKESMEG